MCVAYVLVRHEINSHSGPFGQLPDATRNLGLYYLQVI
jgi:hypothetical protein